VSRLETIRRQIARLEREAERISRASVSKIVAEIKATMKEHGVTIDDLRGASPNTDRRSKARRKKRIAHAANPASKKSAVRSPKRKVKAKYRSQKDKRLTWSGRGRSPIWVREWTASGKKLEELLIK
jgi:DNA-binding protein H-NS